MPRYIVTFLLFIVVVSSSVVAQQQLALRGIVPSQVFEITVQVDDGRDYHQYVLMEDGSVCDFSRPLAYRRCNIDLIQIADKLLDISVIEYTPTLPHSVQWNAWDWEEMKTKPGGYTPVILWVDVRQYNPATDEAKQWRMACSIVPDDPELAACAVFNRYDHFNYITTEASQVVSFVEMVNTNDF